MPSPRFHHVPNPETKVQFRRLRLENNLTLEDIAIAMGSRVNLITKYQNGSTMPSLPTATLLEKVVGIPANSWWNVFPNKPE